VIWFACVDRADNDGGYRMIKKLLASTALAVIFASLSGGSIESVSAADLALKPSDPVAPVATPLAVSNLKCNTR
jgi:hypothetical protein